MRLKIKGGTVDHGQDLCSECAHAHIVSGPRYADHIRRCTVSSGPPIAINFKVNNCTSFQEKETEVYESRGSAIYLNRTLGGGLTVTQGRHYDVPVAEFVALLERQEAAAALEAMREGKDKKDNNERNKPKRSGGA